MKATINGIIYEGTEDEIRRMVENPPNRNGWQEINYPDTAPSTEPYPSWPPSVPSWPNNAGWPRWFETPCQRNWDGSPRVTCLWCSDGDDILC